MRQRPQGGLSKTQAIFLVVLVFPSTTCEWMYIIFMNTFRLASLSCPLTWQHCHSCWTEKTPGKRGGGEVGLSLLTVEDSDFGSHV